MVVMDDTDARGFLFSLDKLFGAKARTATDIKNENGGQRDRSRSLRATILRHMQPREEKLGAA